MGGSWVSGSWIVGVSNVCSLREREGERIQREGFLGGTMGRRERGALRVCWVGEREMIIGLV